MNQLIEFAGNHPYMVAAAVLMIVVVIVSELRARAQAFAAIGTNDAIRLMNQGALMLDVRPAAEFQKGHIGSARNVELSALEAQAESLKKYREKPVITCCDSGMTGATAARQLQKLGFTKVVNLRDGLNAWRKENLPLVQDKAK
jgi:rhodanese-related sulfurtransferase